MLDLYLQKLSHIINLIQFKIGELLFPILEPVFRIMDNKNPEAKKHFEQALNELGKKNLNVALLNLNMVLSLKPNHFMARVYRGRIYLNGGRYRLAAEDYIFANNSNRYRFIHYDLYREYFISLNKGIDRLNPSIVKNFNEVFEAFNDQNKSLEKLEDSEISILRERIRDWEGFDEFEVPDYLDEETFSQEELEKFAEMEPITQNEVDQTDWEVLCKELSSRRDDF